MVEESSFDVLSTSNAFADTLYESPSLILFVLPWTLAFLLALCYVEGGLVISLAQTKSNMELSVNIIGFMLTAPWLLLTVISVVSLGRCLARIYQRQTVCFFLKELGRVLNAWIPKRRLDLAKIFGAVVTWCIASFPFTILIAQLFSDHRVTHIQICCWSLRFRLGGYCNLLGIVACTLLVTDIGCNLCIDCGLHKAMQPASKGL